MIHRRSASCAGIAALLAGLLAGAPGLAQQGQKPMRYGEAGACQVRLRIEADVGDDLFSGPTPAQKAAAQRFEQAAQRAEAETLRLGAAQGRTPESVKAELDGGYKDMQLAVTSAELSNDQAARAKLQAMLNSCMTRFGKG